MKTMAPQEILDLPMQLNDSGESTIRGYLAALVASVWREGEGFSGKRPFGNSAWESDLYPPLVTAELVAGEFVDGYLEEVDEDAARDLIAGAIQALRDGVHVADYDSPSSVDVRAMAFDQALRATSSLHPFSAAERGLQEVIGMARQIEAYLLGIQPTTTTEESPV